MSSALSSAIQRHALAEVQQLLAAGADPNQLWEEGDRPLTLAATLGNKAILRALVKAGADANLANGLGEVPLMIVAKAGDRILCEYFGILTAPKQRQLAEAILAQQPEPPSPQKLVNELVLEALTGNLSDVERLLGAGADARGVSDQLGHVGKTALYAAARNGHAGVVDCLITAGSDLEHVVKKDDLWAGVERTCPQCDEAFVAVQDYGQCPHCKHKFHASLPSYDPSAPRPSLLDKAKVDDATPGIRKTTISPQTLLEHEQPERPPQPWSHHTALMAAVRQNHLAVVKLLVQAGADVNNADARHYGRLPLQIAVEAGFHEMAQCLIEAGSVLDRFEGGLLDEKTPLMRAISQSDTVMVELLIKAGADVNAEAQYCSTALTVAAELGDDAMIQRLQVAGAKQERLENTRLRAAAERGDLAEVKALLNQGIDPNQHDLRNQLPLVQAAAKGHVGVVQCLLDAGADVNRLAANAPLAIAVYFNQVEVVQQLIKAGADVNQRGGVGYPLKIAEGNEYREVASLLKAAGATERPVNDEDEF